MHQVIQVTRLSKRAVSSVLQHSRTMSAAPAAPSSIYDIEVKDAMGKVQPLGDLVRGKAFLVVNTASGCGYTRKFESHFAASAA